MKTFASLLTALVAAGKHSTAVVATKTSNKDKLTSLCTQLWSWRLQAFKGEGEKKDERLKARIDTYLEKASGSVFSFPTSNRMKPEKDEGSYHSNHQVRRPRK